MSQISEANKLNEAPETGSLRTHRAAFMVILSAGFITLLDVSIINVALPSIRATLQATPSDIQWIVAGYSLSFGLVMIPAGRLGDMVGRRRLFILGTAVFGICSLACGAATSPLVLIIARFCQGIGGAMVGPQGMGIIQQLFHGRARAQAYGIYGMIIGVATAIGPVLGGLLVSSFGEIGWRMCFWINIPICVVVIPLAYYLLPSTASQVDRKALSLDLPGMFLLGIAIFFVMLPFLNASRTKRSIWDLPWHYLLVVVVAGALFLAWELWYEKRDKLVIMPYGLRHNAAFIQGVILSMVFFVGWTGLFLTYTLYLQEGLGMSAWAAGLMQMPIAVSSGLASSWSGRLVSRWGAKLLVVTLLFAMVGIAMLIVAAVAVPRPWIPYMLVFGMLVAGVGSGATVSPNNSLSLASVAKMTGSTAGAVLQTAQRVGSAVGLAVVTLIYYTALAHAKQIHGLQPDQTALNSSSTDVLPAYTTAFSLAMATIIAFLFLAWLSAWWGVWVEKKEGARALAQATVAEGSVRPEVP